MRKPPVLPMILAACMILVTWTAVLAEPAPETWTYIRPVSPYYRPPVGTLVSFDGSFTMMLGDTMFITVFSTMGPMGVRLEGIPPVIRGQLIMARRVQGWGRVALYTNTGSVVIQVTGLKGSYR